MPDIVAQKNLTRGRSETMEEWLGELREGAQHVAEAWARAWGSEGGSSEWQLAVAVGLALVAAVSWALASPWPSAVRRLGARFHDEPRRVLVTGAASGVGRLLCSALLAKGHKVLATDRDFRSLKNAAAQDSWSSESSCKLKPLDVTQISDVRRRA
ncbi:Hypothetical Protein FCC1311_049432 [Hondaea fermentalgiana]|uniref:Uncharacterized protein n=1 Tax=Hondaea fermentalgiana TaxID=2315210 RepID=A0A2R5GCM6_9STRA|nr:Hypothetical Protein FCC1311_049432 [Hondaea fermentalgiana]|eukprot:GBG28722.1 Hypothetical Protein FCC1311_049432 [Hondaea fermentalgiana]